MPFSFFHDLAESQPQLVLELKRRWHWRGVTVVTLLSGLGQFLLVHQTFNYWQNYWLNSGVRERLFDVGHTRNLTMAGVWQTDLLRNLLSITFFLLLFLGTYLLRRDWVQEHQRGTLGFLRLTPQPAARIILGKLLGVPILLYWAIALTLPLQIWAAFHALVPGYTVVSMALTDVLILVVFGGIALTVTSSALKLGSKTPLWLLLLFNTHLYLVWIALHLSLFNWEAYLFRVGDLPSNLSALIMEFCLALFFGLICMPLAWSASVHRFHRPHAPLVFQDYASRIRDLQDQHHAQSAAQTRAQMRDQARATDIASGRDRKT